MDRNLLLAFALSFLVLAIWSTLQAPPPEEPYPPREAASEEPPARSPHEPLSTSAEPEPSRSPEVATPVVVEPAAQEIQVRTRLYDATFSTRGAGVVSWRLEGFRESRDPGSSRLALTTFDPLRTVGLATPFEELDAGDLSLAGYSWERPDSRTLVFTTERRAVAIRKTYHFADDSYALRLRIDLENRSDRALDTTLALRWPGQKREGGDFQDHGLAALHQGSVERTRWTRPAAMACAGGGGGDEEQSFVGDVEWAGEETRYFLAVMLPELPRNARARFAPGSDDESGTAEVSYQPIRLPPGQSLSREYRIYIGPKDPEQLAATGANLEQAINIGWAWVAPLTRFFSWLLHAFHAVIPNYGIAIILITVLVRLATAPLTQRQMRSMRRLGELQPKLKELQEKYKDDRQRQSQEMMNMYRSAGVNPLGGCLPMVLQFPVFIGLFYALQSSIDLRQAPFVLWIDDLSLPETLFVIPGLELPFRVLPILMGVSMVGQQKLTPTTMDPAQARMMLTVMPVMFTLLFYRFPSGLVLYWFVSNLLAIGHQLFVNRAKRAAG